MRLLWIQIENIDCTEMMDELKRCGYKATLISSTEDFLKYGDTTILLGVDEKECDDVIKKIKAIYKENSVIGNMKENVSIYVVDSVKSIFIKPALK